MIDQILETYNPPLTRWVNFNDVYPVQLLAKLLMDGATTPIGKFSGPNGVFLQSLGDFFDTEKEAVRAAVKEHTQSIAELDRQWEQLSRDIKIHRRQKLEYQQRLAKL